MPDKSMKMRDEDYIKLKSYAEKHGISITQALHKMTAKLEVRKTEPAVKTVREVKFDTCDECGKEIPEDSAFCPYCGVEFDEEDDDEEEEED